MWALLSVIIYLLVSISMPWQPALIRTVVITLWFMASYYITYYLFTKTVHKGNSARYFTYTFILIIIVSLIRYIIELILLPVDTQLFFFGGAKVGRPAFLIATSFVATFIASIVHYMYYYSGREKEALRMINKEKEAKLQYLHAQINPHFLFNALNNIYSLSITNSPKTPEMLLTLTDILRYSVYQNDRKTVSVAEEAEQIEFLIKLFNLKNDDSYHVTFNKNKVLGYIEPMILVPLAENCLKHSDFAVNPNAYATMTLESDERNIKFTTENTFSSTIKQDKIGGVGLANITERLTLVYPGSHSIHTTTHNGIYKVELKIQWNKH